MVFDRTKIHSGVDRVSAEICLKVFSIVTAAWVMSDCAACLSRGIAGIPPAFINYELQFDL